MAQNNYRGKNCDLDTLFKECEDWFTQRKYQTQTDVNKGTWLLQARQADAWRAAVGASRAFNVLIQGEPNDFSVTLTTGEWATNLAAGGVAAVLTGGATLLISGVTIGWSKKIEGDISAFIEQRILFGEKAKSSHEQAIAQSQRLREEKLQQLKEALDNGFITQTAYNAKKQELEGQLHSAVEASAAQTQLAKLKELFDAGILNQEEYETKKREVMQSSDSERDALLSNLRAALDAGILTEAEYEAKKTEIDKQPAHFAKIKQLEDARDAGVLSDEEFEIKKKALLEQE
jgi:hypothetical protein